MQFSNGMKVFVERANMKFCINDLAKVYILSIENEIEIDKTVYSNFRISPRSVNFLPRPTRWSKYWPKYRLLIKIAGFLLRIVWLLGGAAILFILQAAKIKFKTCNNAHKKQLNNHNKKYLLAFSDRSVNIIPRTIPNIELTIIKFPWRPLQNHLEAFDICSLLKMSEITRAYYLALQSIYYFAMSKNGSWVLSTFNAFEWFCARFAIDKLDGDFYISEHYDRWSVLADNSIDMKNKSRICNGKPEYAIHLIQHGSLRSLSGIDSDNFKLRLAYRLRHVRELWVYDEYSRNIFLQQILEEAINEKEPVIKYFSPTIITEKKDSDGRFAILFVGHPASESIQIYLNKK